MLHKLKFGVSLVIAVCMMTTHSPLQAQNGVMPDTSGAWYDIDGDGKMEYYWSNHLYKLDESNNPVETKFLGLNNGITSPQIYRMRSDMPLFVLSDYRRVGYIVNQDCSLTEFELPDYLTFKTYNTFLTYYPADINNDGLKELACKTMANDAEFDKAYLFDSGMNLTPDNLNIMTWNDYNNLRSELTLSSGGDGVPGMNDMYGSDSGGKTFGDFQTLDLNGDGLTDMIDGPSGKYYLNTGLGSFVSNTFGGTVTPRDINNDGITDFIVFDSNSLTLKLIKSNGGDDTYETELLKGYYCSNRAWCYDFDKDGDVDILLPIDTKTREHDNGAAFLVYFENDGKGNFTRHENWIDGTLQFFDCLDFDADGKYEIVAMNQKRHDYHSGYFDLRFYEISGRVINDIPEIFYDSPNSCYYAEVSLLPVNLDNSGITTLTLKAGTDGNFVAYSSERAGTKPAAPGRPEYLYDEQSGLLKVFWSAATDAESPSADLTYEIRVGTAQGLDDVVAVDALTDGRRRNLAQGANGHQLYHAYNVKVWPAGKYYISVQAIDPNMLGSQFSDCAVFEKKSPAAEFTIDAPANTSVGDVITMKLNNATLPGETVSWALDGADILSSMPGNGEVSVKFTTPGEKKLKVSVSDLTGASSVSPEHFLEIYPAKVDSVASFDYNPFRYIVAVFDLDADGSEEYISSIEEKLMEQNEAGEANIIRKMYNTNLQMNQYFKPVDVNRDGLIDILNHKSPYSNNYKVWTNNGNKDLTIGDSFSLFKGGQYETVILDDFDNDGSLEAVSSAAQYYKISDDCQTYENFTLDNLPQPARLEAVYDFNGDGLPDLYVKLRTNPDRYTATTPFVYYNNGDGTFTNGGELPSIKGAGEPIAPSLAGDFDSDGIVDLAFNAASYGFGISFYTESFEIQYGNGKVTTVLCPDGRAFDSFYGSFDFDNNGFTDFVVRLSDKSFVIVYIYSDYRYKIVDVPDTYVSNECNAVLHRNNGTTFINNVKRMNIANEPPTTPGGLRHTVNGKSVNIAWDKASDKETPSAGLKYNISVKRKGAIGAGAYLLSPMNQDKDGVAPPSNFRLLVQPRICIPISSIPAGEYEVRVQAVDNQNVAGSFSDVYMMSVPELANIDAPTSAVVGSPVTVTYIGNQAQAFIDFGKDSEAKASGNTYEVTWLTEGLKTISVNGNEAATLMVYNAPEADFTLAGEVLEGATVNVPCSSAKSGNWYFVEGDNAVFLAESPRIKALSVNDDGLTFTVTGEKDFILRHTVTESYGRNTVEHGCKVNSVNALPSIDYVSVSADGRFNEIRWNAAQLPTSDGEVNIYRETSRINEFELIGTAPAAEGRFTDMSSRPDIKAERYVITVSLPYGESAKSELHQTMLLQLNHGLANSVNLRWSKYEGRTVTSYQVYAGDDTESLQLLESVSGNLNSYIDREPKNYYAVSVLFGNPSKAEMRKVISPSAADASLSNMVSLADASQALLAQNLDLYVAGGSDVLDLDKSKTLKVSALLSPAGVSITRLNWEISEGQDIATVDGNGLVTVTGRGDICVTARTCDGSELTSSIYLTTIGGEILVESINISPNEITGSVNEVYPIEVNILPRNATNKNVTLNIDNTEIAILVDDSQIKLLTPGFTTITATATDGSGVTATCSVIVTEDSGITDIEIVPDTHVKIFNIQGTLVYEGEYAHSNLTPGIYIIICQGNSIKRIIR